MSRPDSQVKLSTESSSAGYAKAAMDEGIDIFETAGNIGEPGDKKYGRCTLTP